MTTPRLVDVIHWLEDVFNRVGLRRSYGGAIAYNYHGPPRLTRDVDVLVLIPDTKVPTLVEALSAAGCLLGDVDPRPLDLPSVLAEFRGKARMATFLYRGTRVEVFLPWHPFHHRVLDRSPERDLEGRRIRIHTAEDLIVFKKVFDRPKDLTDIQAILIAKRGHLDTVRMLGDAVGLLDERSLAELATLVRDLTTARSG